MTLTGPGGIPVRRALTLAPLLALLLAGPAALAQQQPAPTQPPAQSRSGGASEGSGASVAPTTGLTPSGERSPSAALGSGSPGALYGALAAVRQAPPDLAGNPVPRPNPLASEPDDPNEPTRNADPSDQTSREVK